MVTQQWPDEEPYASKAAPAPSVPDVDVAVKKWIEQARSSGSGIQRMIDVDGAEALLTAFIEQRECDRIDLADARGTIRRQADLIERQAAEIARLRAMIAKEGL